MWIQDPDPQYNKCGSTPLFVKKKIKMLTNSDDNYPEKDELWWAVPHDVEVYTVGHAHSSNAEQH